MNILILSWRGPGHPNAGGAEQVTLEHAKGWIRGGHNVSLFTSFYKGAKKEEVIEGVKIYRSGDQFFGVKIKAFMWYMFGTHPKFDLVMDEFHGIPFFTPLYVRVKKFAFIHEVAREVWKLNILPKPINLIPAIIGPLIEPLIFKIFYRRTRFVTVSESTKNDLIDLGIANYNITVINNGVKLCLSKIRFVKDKVKTAVYLGAISKDKGTEDALKVFSEINKIDSNWQYWVIGKGSTEFVEDLKKMCEIYGIHKNVKFWGFVSDKKKFELLSRSHILINPSVLEGWGLVNIEANASGVPVIAYNVSGIKDSVINGKTGYLCEFGDYKCLSQKVLELLQNKSLYKKMQKNAIQWSSKFSWKKSSQLSLEYIESLN